MSRWLVLMLLGAGMFLVSTVAAALVAERSGWEASRWVAHTAAVRFAIATARLHLRDAEIASARGRPSEDALRALRDDVHELRELTVDNAAQQVRLDRLEAELAAAERGTAVTWTTDNALEVVSELRGEEDGLMIAREAAERAARTRTTVVVTASGVLTFFFVLAAAVTLSRQRTEMARQSALLESILDGIGEGVMAIDADKQFLVANPAARRFFAVEVGAVLSANWTMAHEAVTESGEPLPAEYGPLTRAVRGESSDDITFFLKHPERDAGTWMTASGRPLVGPDGRVFGGVAVYRDVSEQRRKDEELRALSLTDELTGLHNRRSFMLLAEHHAKMATRTGQTFAILFADLNGLKKINDGLGHEEGDRAIRDFGSVLRRTVRDTDVVARLGGDEFVALLTNATPTALQLVERRLRDTLAQENEVPGHKYRLSVSTGVATFDPAAPRSVTELLADADQRMYAQKEERRASAKQRAPAGQRVQLGAGSGTSPRRGHS